METDRTLLDYLERRRGEYCSGEALSQALGVSRTMIWKRIQELRDKGLVIVASRNRGYMLAEETDVLSPEGIGKYLSDDARRLRLEVVDETRSTNLDVRARAEKGEPEGLVLMARRQSGGRGRRERAFYSPDSGLYLSLLLRPKELPAERAGRFTTLSAVAVCDAIEATTQLKARIRWVNDVLLHTRKVCGILTEAQCSLENATLEYVVVGVGVNLYVPDGGFPEELRAIAGVVYDSPRGDGRNRFVAEFLNALTRRLVENDEERELAEYRGRLLAQGRRGVVLLPGGETRDATLLDVDEQYRLVVRYDDGTVAALSSAEVSVRPGFDEQNFA